MSGGFLDWWGRELAAVAAAAVPTALRQRLWPGRPRLIAEPDAAGGFELTLSARSDRALGTLIELDAKARRQLTRAIREGRARMVLALPEERVLRRQVSLPLAAEADLDQVIRFEIDRLTPFRAEELHYAHRITGRDAKAGKLGVELFFLPREQARAALEELGAADLPPTRIDIRVGAGFMGLDLLRDKARDGWSLQAQLAAGLFGLSFMLGAVLIVLMLNAREQELTALQDALGTARREAIAAQETAAAGQASDSLTVAAYELRRQRARFVDALNAITEALPDDTHVETLQLSDGEALVTGRSADASALIPLLDAHPLLERPGFRAPVTRDRDGGERFSLSVGFRPEAEGIR